MRYANDETIAHVNYFNVDNQESAHISAKSAINALHNSMKFLQSDGSETFLHVGRYFKADDEAYGEKLKKQFDNKKIQDGKRSEERIEKLKTKSVQLQKISALKSHRVCNLPAWMTQNNNVIHDNDSKKIKNDTEEFQVNERNASGNILNSPNLHSTAPKRLKRKHKIDLWSNLYVKNYPLDWDEQNLNDIFSVCLFLVYLYT